VIPKQWHKTPEKLTQRAAKILSQVNSRAKCIKLQEKSLDPFGDQQEKQDPFPVFNEMT